MLTNDYDNKHDNKNKPHLLKQMYNVAKILRCSCFLKFLEIIFLKFEQAKWLCFNILKVFPYIVIKKKIISVQK